MSFLLFPLSSTHGRGGCEEASWGRVGAAGWTQTNPFPLGPPQGTEMPLSTVGGDGQRGGQEKELQGQGGWPNGCVGWEICLHSRQPVCSWAHSLGAIHYTVKAPAAMPVRALAVLSRVPVGSLNRKKKNHLVFQ